MAPAQPFAIYRALLEPCYERSPGRSRVVSELIVGAITEVIYHYVSIKREHELPSLLPEP